MDDLDPFNVDVNAGGAVLLLIAFLSGVLVGGAASWWFV
jgi:hypothetical protein